MIRDAICMDTDQTERSGRWIKELPAALTAAAVIAGAMVYGLLATAYDEFYAELGLTPSDVGITYGQALGGAAALSILVVLLMVGLTSGFWLVAKRLRDRTTTRRVWLYLIVAMGGSGIVTVFTGSLSGLTFLVVVISLSASAHPKVSDGAGPIAYAGVCGVTSRDQISCSSVEL